MPHPDKNLRSFLQAYQREVIRMLGESAAAEAPTSVFKLHYEDMLATALATGELADWSANYYVDPATGILTARTSLLIPKHPGW